MRAILYGTEYLKLVSVENNIRCCWQTLTQESLNNLVYKSSNALFDLQIYEDIIISIAFT